MLPHLGVALIVDNRQIVSIREVLIPLEDEVERKLEEILGAHNADAILGLISMDELHVAIDEKQRNLNSSP